MLLPSTHTQLMNYIIGLCRPDAGWPSSLADLGYEVQVIEQTIGTAQGERVKPDIIAASNRYLHALVLDCKGGVSIDKQQVARYGGLTGDDLTRWVTVHSPNHLMFDVCFPIMKSKESALLEPTNPYPIISFSSAEISKVRDFSQDPLNLIFPISLDCMTPPLNYYPFSDQDKEAVIVPRVLRMIVQVALASVRSGATSLDSTIYTEDVIAQIHPYWNALSTDHRSALIERVRKMVKHLLDTQPSLRASLEELEGKTGYKMLASLKAVKKSAEEIATKMETQETMKKYLP